MPSPLDCGCPELARLLQLPAFSLELWSALRATSNSIPARAMILARTLCGHRTRKRELPNLAAIKALISRNSWRARQDKTANTYVIEIAL